MRVASAPSTAVAITTAAPAAVHAETHTDTPPRTRALALAQDEWPAKRRVLIFDTTLRDGEQSPGIHLDVPAKLAIATQLARLRVDVIEAGFPAASDADAAAVAAIAAAVDGPVICALARAHAPDIEAAGVALEAAARRRIHTFIATSPIHMEHKLRLSANEVLGRIAPAVALARGYTDDVEFSCEDATRTEREFLAACVREAIAAGASTINIPDTVGYTTPTEFARLLLHLAEDVPELSGVRLSVHCHDDMGLAVANSLAGILAGARQVECCINGIGERAGNTALEEIVMLLRARAEAAAGCWTNVDTPQLTRTSNLVRQMTGYAVAPNKAIVGANAFAHEAGIHQHGVLANPLTYEVLQAADVGRDAAQLVLGKHSGRHALRHVLTEMGHELDEDAFEDLFVRFKELASRKGALSADDLEALVGERLGARAAPVLVRLAVQTEDASPPRARVLVRDDDGYEREGVASGDGPVDAIMHAIDAALGTSGRLCDFTVRAVGAGREALGEAQVRVQLGEATATGVGVDTDVLRASALAYLAAIAHARAAAERAAPPLS